MKYSIFQISNPQKRFLTRDLNLFPIDYSKSILKLKLEDSINDLMKDKDKNSIIETVQVMINLCLVFLLLLLAERMDEDMPQVASGCRFSCIYF